ncbi:phage tail fiber protein [Bradyrhizobium cenepequi]
MSKSDAFELDMVKLIFNGTPIANLADNAASSPLGSLYLSLHLADPGDAGNQATNEVSYTGYARVAVARTAAGFTCSGSSPAQAVTAADNDFPADTGGTQGTAAYFGVGVALSGATKLLYSGPITPNIILNNGVTPRLAAGTKCTED